MTMKSSYCSRYMHKMCGKGRAVECDCQCHVAEVRELSPPPVEEKYDLVAPYYEPRPVDGPQPPPPHPEPFDHMIYRIAEEPPGTNFYDPWVLDNCIECRLPVWGHNAVIAAKHETLCELCAYDLLVQLTEDRVRIQNQIARRAVNPFLLR